MLSHVTQYQLAEPISVLENYGLDPNVVDILEIELGIVTIGDMQKVTDSSLLHSRGIARSRVNQVREALRACVEDIDGARKRQRDVWNNS